MLDYYFGIKFSLRKILKNTKSIFQVFWTIFDDFRHDFGTILDLGIPKDIHHDDKNGEEFPRNVIMMIKITRNSYGISSSWSKLLGIPKEFHGPSQENFNNLGYLITQGGC